MHPRGRIGAPAHICSSTACSLNHLAARRAAFVRQARAFLFFLSFAARACVTSLVAAFADTLSSALIQY